MKETTLYKMTQMKKWIIYIIILGFAAYWASNLLLWFPWSYSATLGITLMLTFGVALWAFVIFTALRTYPHTALIYGALIIALIFLLISVIMDYLFFGLIRNAMQELYHPTTFYGYGFLMAWPVILALVFNKQIAERKKTTTHSAIIQVAVSGLICFGILTLIIVSGIQI